MKKFDFLLIICFMVFLSTPSFAGMVSKKTEEVKLHNKLTTDLLVRFLKKWEIKNIEVGKNFVVTKLNYKEYTYNLKLIIIDKKILIIRIEDWFFIPGQHLNFNRIVKRLMIENYRLTVGKITWDPMDGEVCIEHALVSRNGISYDDFIEVIIRLLITANTKYPVLMKSMWK